MVTPDALDRIADRQERQGARVFFRALKTLQTKMALQVEQGQEPQPDESIVRNALTRYHFNVAWEMAQWQYNDLARRNPIKAMQIGHQERTIGLINTWIKLNLGTSIKSISQTSLEQVRKAIIEGQEKGWGARKIAAKIRQDAKGEFTAYRSTLISRTEGTRAASYGAKVGAEQWESISGQKKWKAWSAVNQTRTRDAHIAMLDSLPIPGDQDFIVGGVPMDGPGDPKGGKANIINCRCRRYYMSERMARSIIAASGNTVPKNPLYPDGPDFGPASIPAMPVKPEPTSQPLNIPKKPRAPRKPRMSQPVPDAYMDELDRAMKIFESHKVGKDSIEAMETFYSNAARAFGDAMTKIEKAAINNYSSSFYSALNEYKRTGQLPRYGSASKTVTPEFLEAHAKVLNHAIDKVPEKYTGEVYRSIDIDIEDLEDRDFFLNAYNNAYENNEIFSEPAFMSTSYRKESAFSGNVSFVIQSKKGAMIEQLSQIPTEREVLFKAGQQFKVTGFVVDGRRVRISMEEL